MAVTSPFFYTGREGQKALAHVATLGSASGCGQDGGRDDGGDGGDPENLPLVFGLRSSLFPLKGAAKAELPIFLPALHPKPVSSFTFLFRFTRLPQERAGLICALVPSDPFFRHVR